MDTPSYPGPDDELAPPGRSRRFKATLLAIVIAVVLVVMLHLTGVVGGGH